MSFLTERCEHRHVTISKNTTTDLKRERHYCLAALRCNCGNVIHYFVIRDLSLEDECSYNSYDGITWTDNKGRVASPLFGSSINKLFDEIHVDIYKNVKEIPKDIL